MYKLDITEYSITSSSFERGVTLAIAADLHSNQKSSVEQIIRALEDKRPDFILAPGDIFERLDGSCSEGMSAGLELLSRAASIAPTFYSFGNHENGGVRSWNKLKWSRIKSIPKHFDAESIRRIAACGVHILDDGYTVVDNIALGGLTSGLINEGRAPDISWLDELCNLKAPKILLCHHPEYYEKYLALRELDIIVAGHAHGGQWRFFGRGVFAPGQGIFPKYTAGVHSNRLIVSRGLKPSGHIPRIFNRPELVFVNINK